MTSNPIGSPTAPPGRHAALPGWYPDPSGDKKLERYWDGWQWSQQTRDASATSRTQPSETPTHVLPQPAIVARPATGQYIGMPVARSSSGLALASWGARFGALILDAIILTPLIVLAMLPVWKAIGHSFMELMRWQVDHPQERLTQQMAQEMVARQDSVMLAIGGSLIAFAYSLAFLRFAGATLGQRMCGVQVVAAKTALPARHLSWKQAIVRSAIWGLATFHLVFFLINGIVGFASRSRRTLADLIAGTDLVRRSELTQTVRVSPALMAPVSPQWSAPAPAGTFGAVPAPLQGAALPGMGAQTMPAQGSAPGYPPLPKRQYFAARPQQ